MARKSVYREQTPIGKVFGNLEVISNYFMEGKYSNVICRCVCGKEKNIKCENLVKGSTTSCGCKGIEDLAGKVFGKWKVISKNDKASSRHSYYNCECSCGKIKIIRGNHLSSGNTSSCKSCSRLKDITGKRFGRLRVLVFYPAHQSSCLCICDCGNEKIVRAHMLSSGNIKSCGCLRKEFKGGKTTHGKSRSKIYVTYRSVLNRCFNSKNKSYPGYGGRGITVCSYWKERFENFYLDMGDPPSKLYSIERIDVNGNYSCGHCGECIENGWKANCKWATTKEQNNNTRRSVKIFYSDELLTITEWSERLGILSNTIRERLKRGWTIEQALTQPPRKAT